MKEKKCSDDSWLDIDHAICNSFDYDDSRIN